MRTEINTIHLSLTLTLNNDSGWGWTSPKVEENIQFSIPAELFNSAAVSKMIEKRISLMEKTFPAVVKQAEAEKLAEEQAKADEAAKLAEEVVIFEQS